MKNIARATVMVILTGVFCLSGFKLFQMSEGYIHEAQVKDELTAFSSASSRDDQPENTNMPETAFIDSAKPELSNSAETIPPDPSPVKTVVNQNIVNMQNEINRDVIGWLTIPGTKIDYPFVKGADNDYYINRDLHGNDALAGTIFIDERNAADFTDFNTILYGHNMRNGTMFGELPLYADEWCFSNSHTGTLYLPYATCTLEIFAYMVVRSDDKFIYNPEVDSDLFFDYVRENARNYREPMTQGRVVTLSACAYEFDSARVVVTAILNS